MEENKKRIFTKGDVEVQNIKIGDIHWEYEMGFYAKVEVITLPEKNVDEDGDTQWRWKSKLLEDGKISDNVTSINFVNAGEEVQYLTTEGLSHYGPNLYTNPAYHPLEYQRRWADEQHNETLKNAYGGVNSPD